MPRQPWDQICQRIEQHIIDRLEHGVAPENDPSE